MYRLHHNVEVGTGFTTKHKDSVNSVLTERSGVTDLYTYL